MSNTLTAAEQRRLAKLGKDIRENLSCDNNDTGVPCRTCRLAAVKDMKTYLKIHDYKVTD